ncbi:MAG: cytochrome c3 family protein [Anaerolineales bacterium]
MKKILFSMTIMIVLLAGTYSLALADNGPHGGFTTPTTDSCGGCHRAHTGAEEKLLMTSTSTLCESCHGPAGTGADTDVWDGIYLSRDATNENPSEGVANRGLKSGGFVNSVMNTALAGSASSAATTSSHTFDGQPGIIWGNGNSGSGAGTSTVMDCASCHNPHGNAGPNGSATYRILRPSPEGSGATTSVVISDPSGKNYTIDDASGNYWGQNYGAVENSMADWCAQCHTRYLAGTDAESTSSNDPIFNFRHRSNGSDGVTCSDCHVAHGTSASMGPISGAVPWPDDSSTPSGDHRSSLLRLDNRGVCVQCHQNP